MTESHQLLSYFIDAVDGRFPPADGGVTLVPALPRGLECSVAFTGHAVIATDLPADDVHAQGPDGLGGSFAPEAAQAEAQPGEGGLPPAESVRARHRVPVGRDGVRHRGGGDCFIGLLVPHLTNQTAC